MKKRLALIIGILTVASAFAAPPGLGAPDTGSTPNGSWVDVRVTANVVEGIAVNEASPIDFGNLVKDNNAEGENKIYQEGEKINNMTDGRVVYRANTTGYSGFTTRLDRDRINLAFTGDSGVVDEKSTNTVINNVKIEGIGITPEPVQLNNGQATKTLTAWFQAYNSAPAGTKAVYVSDYKNGNLGSNQKLGYYEGTVRVYAESIKNKIG